MKQEGFKRWIRGYSKSERKGAQPWTEKLRNKGQYFLPILMRCWSRNTQLANQLATPKTSPEDGRQSHHSDDQGNSCLPKCTQYKCLFWIRSWELLFIRNGPDKKNDWTYFQCQLRSKVNLGSDFQNVPFGLKFDRNNPDNNLNRLNFFQGHQRLKANLSSNFQNALIGLRPYI